MQDAKALASEKALRKLIIENLQKKHHPNTKSSIDFIAHILKEAYEGKAFAYDVSDLYADTYSFAMNSSNNARYCMQAVQEMKWMSEDIELQTSAENDRLVFYDVEVFPNLLVICWKYEGESNIVRMINPSPEEVDELLGMKLIGFNCRKYDNHILYARAMGESIEQIYKRSSRIVDNDKTAMFGPAYELSYTDIYDFSSVKQSLKKFEIDLGIHHMELGLPWDEPVDKELWDKVCDYCCNDVIATEETFKARKGDFLAREILSALSGLSVNATTNSHTTKIIFGDNKYPQKEFVYYDLATGVPA